jgi:hypothetical protein
MRRSTAERPFGIGRVRRLDRPGKIKIKIKIKIFSQRAQRQRKSAEKNELLYCFFRLLLSLRSPD